MLVKQTIDYYDGDTLLKGYCAYDDAQENKRPAVLIAPDWSGRNIFVCEKAEQLANLGYVGFALDMYGNATLGQTNEEKSALMQPFMQDRARLQHRMLAALKTVQQLKMVNSEKIGAIGFCFGGLCVLDLARSGTDIQGVVSFHGLLQAPEHATKQIKARILALHGYADPMVTPDKVNAFAEEMTRAKANWEIDMYGNVMHAFTNPVANDPGFGTVYNEQAAKRSWQAMENFLRDLF